MMLTAINSLYRSFEINKKAFDLGLPLRVRVNAVWSSYSMPSSVAAEYAGNRHIKYTLKKGSASTEKFMVWLDESKIPWQIDPVCSPLENGDDDNGREPSSEVCAEADDALVVIFRPDVRDTIRAALLFPEAMCNQLFLEYPTEPIDAETLRSIRWILRNGGAQLLTRFYTTRPSQKIPKRSPFEDLFHEIASEELKAYMRRRAESTSIWEEDE